MSEEITPDASSLFQDSLPIHPDMLISDLTTLKIQFEQFNHPPLKTVEDSKAHRDGMLTKHEGGGHIKNLYLRDRKKRNFLVVAQEDRQIDLKSLGGQIGSDRLSFGSADRLFEMLGVRPGAVSPFALINDPDHKVQLILDADLAGQSFLYAHPLVNDMTIGLSGADLLRFTAYTGHQPQLLSFA